MHQGPYESIITYKEHFDIALKAYQEQENAELDESDVAMDFFDGLENARYAEFKKSILNGMTAGSMTRPAMLNEMYLLANQWLKTTSACNQNLLVCSLPSLICLIFHRLLAKDVVMPPSLSMTTRILMKNQNPSSMI
jgi:hypothetical protein